MKTMKRNLLITGRPGCGKTTLVEKTAARLGERAMGFFSREIRQGGRRVGFSIKTLDGKNGTLAHKDSASSFRLGRYGVNIDDIERVALPPVREAVRSGKVVVIDEIARMELFCPAFKDAVLEALDSPSFVLATLQMGRDPFLDEVRQRSDVRIFTLNRENRDLLSETIVSYLIGTKG